MIPPTRKKRGRPPTGLPRKKRVVDYARQLREKAVQRKRARIAMGIAFTCTQCKGHSAYLKFCSTTCANLWNATCHA